MKAAVLALWCVACVTLLACGGGHSSRSTPVATETSGWKLYRDALGFSIRYPTSWKVQTHETGAKILNEKRQQQTKSEGGDSGEAWVEIGYDARPGFDTQALIGSCESVGAQIETDVQLGGRPTLRCIWPDNEKDVYSGLPSGTRAYWINFPAGHTLSLVTYAIDTGAATYQLLDRITTSFETSS